MLRRATGGVDTLAKRFSLSDDLVYSPRQVNIGTFCTLMDGFNTCHCLRPSLFRVHVTCLVLSLHLTAGDASGHDRV